MFGKEKTKEVSSPSEIIDQILTKAIRNSVSDVHIQREKDNAKVRLRIDGILRDTMFIKASDIDGVISRMKVMANLNITERRTPQVGHFSYEVFEPLYNKSGEDILPQKTFDFRVSIHPTLYGEAIVLRLLNRETYLKKIENLDFTDENLGAIRRLIRKQYGMVLVTGPSGSGKTTTLYSILNELNSNERNIVTLEDPVEYAMPNLRQSQINPDIGFDFARGLKSLLRQDPDVLMFGEIRDEESTEISIRAALGGILLLSTLHTVNALGTIIRLLDMKLGRSVIAQALSGIISQRLVRKICQSCKGSYQPEAILMKELHIQNGEFYQGSGCEKCGGSGYFDRIAIQEVLPITKEMRNVIIEYKSISDFDDYLMRINFKSLRDDGILKMQAGLTTLEELVKVIGYE